MIRLADIRDAMREGPVALVMVSKARGSAPREAGAAMLVWPDRTTGTIGGGAAEHRATEIARQMLSGGERTAEVALPLGPALDQCCGGQMELALAVFDEASHETGDRTLSLWPGGPVFREPTPHRPVFVYGAGHVGHALIRALAPLPFLLTWVDAREGQMADTPAGIDCIETPLPEAAVEIAGAEALHVVMTHSHALDLEIVTAILSRPFGFCGLIGSATKRALFLRRLSERGVAQTAIDRLTCPIGLRGLRDKRPEVIAASVAAQLLQVDAALSAVPDTEAG